MAQNVMTTTSAAGHTTDANMVSRKLLIFLVKLSGRIAGGNRLNYDDKTKQELSIIPNNLVTRYNPERQLTSKYEVVQEDS